MHRLLLASALVTAIVTAAAARETVCDRHTEGGRVLQTCRFVESAPQAAVSPAAPHSVPPTAQSQPRAPAPQTAVITPAQRSAPPAPPDLPQYYRPACARNWCGPPGLEPGFGQ